jgi:hypothetical protein
MGAAVLDCDFTVVQTGAACCNAHTLAHDLLALGIVLLFGTASVLRNMIVRISEAEDKEDTCEPNKEHGKFAHVNLL